MELDTIGRDRKYRILRHIADGGMGSVHEAQLLGAEGFRKTVAVKTLLPEYAKHPEFIRLCIGEAKLVADLVHENIVQVYDLGHEDDRYYIVMEYVDGLNLEAYIRTHLEQQVRLPIELGAFISSRVCRGLDYAHLRTDREGVSLGIVHRDISPKNVMLNFEGVVKVTDFGIAKAREVMEQDEELFVGRIEYMPPEQATRRPTDARSDVYALGVLTHELLTGKLPDRGRWSLQRLHKHGVSFPKPISETRSDVPDDLAAIVDRALQPDPADRFQTAGEMGFALEYHLYHDGYGPTNETLRDYLRERLPSLTTHFGESDPAVQRSTPSLIEQRADTVFGARLEDEPPE